MSAVSIVTDDREEGVRALIRAEHPAPAYYEKARSHFIKVLERKLTLEQAVRQAHHVQDATERRCALEILDKSKAFLAEQDSRDVIKLPSMQTFLPNNKILKITPVWIQDCRPYRLMILHFWYKPLSELQIKAAAGILSYAIENSYRKYLGFELDFISVAIPEHAAGRRFEVMGWDKIQPLRDADLQNFLVRLCDVWDEYHRRGPRQVRYSRRNGQGSFSFS